MASRDVWAATELRELLMRRAGLEMSLQAVAALIRKQPAQVKVTTLQALCTTLRCTPNELFGVDRPDDVSLVDDLGSSQAPGEQ